MGQLRRFFAFPYEKQGNKIELKSEYNHLALVLRCKVGELFTVCFNDGYDNTAQVTSVNKDTVFLDIIDTVKNKSESKFDVTLFVGVIKGDGMDLCVQKAVELGVNHIVPFVSKYTIASCETVKANRLTKISQEASKQCCRARLVNVDTAISFNQMLDKLDSFDQVLFCNERGGKNLFSMINNQAKTIAVVIGSEGGFSDEEANILSSKCISVSLGERILRAETACIYSLCALDIVSNNIKG